LLSFIWLFIALSYLLIIRREKKTLRDLLDVPGIMLFLAIVLPWHILAALHDPLFFH